MFFIEASRTFVTGHYRAVFYGKDGDPEAKAKSKVFKVTCDGGGGGRRSSAGCRSDRPAPLPRGIIRVCRRSTN